METDNIAQRYATALTEKFTEEERLVASATGHDPEDIVVEVHRGHRFDKLVLTEYHSRAVHAFVERKTGLLIKPATWSNPQRNQNGFASNYDLTEQFDLAVSDADRNGKYLYAN